MNRENFDQLVCQKIPLLQAMSAQLKEISDRHCRFTAPLTPNINDKGTGFAGSIASLSLITGWSLASFAAMDEFEKPHVVIKQNEMRYLRPVRSDFFSKTEISEEDLDHYLKQLRETQRASLKIEVIISDQSGICATMKGEYITRIPQDQ